MPREFNPLQLDELKKIKPGISRKLVEKLHGRLYALESSARYIFLAPMHVAQFFQKDSAKAKAFEQLTFEQLIEIGAINFCLREGVGKSRVEALIEILDTLMHGDQTFSIPQETVQPAPVRNVDFVPRIARQTSTQSEIPIISSVESARRIKEGIRRLRILPDFASLADMKLQEVWDETIVRAPFIEDLTFRELCELDVDLLLKKRSFSERKIYALIQTLDKVVEQRGKQESHLAPTPEAIVTRASQGRSVKSTSSPVELQWRGEGTLSPQFRHLLRLYSFEAAQVSEKSDMLASLLRNIPDHLEAPEFVAYLLFADRELQSAEQLARVIGSDLDLLVERCASVIGPLFEEHLGSAYSTWKLLLATPALSEDRLLDAVVEFKSADGFLRSIARLGLVSLGGRPPEFQGSQFSGHWSSNPEALTIVMQSLLQSLPIDDRSFRMQLSGLFPLADQADLIAFMKSLLVFDSSLASWVQMHD